MGLELNVVAKGITDSGRDLKIGEVVYYCAHLPGGNVRIQFMDGTKDIAHPECFDELKD